LPSSPQLTCPPRTPTTTRGSPCQSQSGRYPWWFVSVRPIILMMVNWKLTAVSQSTILLRVFSYLLCWFQHEE
jgi:hypothetical protein